MSKREKIMATAVVILLVAWGGTQLWKRYQEMLTTRSNSLIAAREELDATKLAELRGRRAMENVQTWQGRSLPGNLQQARALYRTWLLDRLRESGLTDNVLKYSAQMRQSDAYEIVGFTIEAKGSTDAVTQFLYDFYHSDHLHKIVHLRLRPEGDSAGLYVTMRVEGLIVDGALRDDTLSEGTSDRLALDSADAYQESIGGRNLFESYSQRSEPQSQPRPDLAGDTWVTFIQADAGQVWLTMRNTSRNRVMRLRVGDRVRVPGFFGKVEEIRANEVVLSRGEEQIVVRIGKNLQQGRPLEIPSET